MSFTTLTHSHKNMAANNEEAERARSQEFMARLKARAIAESQAAEAAAAVLAALAPEDRFPLYPIKRQTHKNCFLCTENQSSYSNRVCEGCGADLTIAANVHYT